MPFASVGGFVPRRTNTSPMEGMSLGKIASLASFEFTPVSWAIREVKRLDREGLQSGLVQSDLAKLLPLAAMLSFQPALKGTCSSRRAERAAVLLVCDDKEEVRPFRRRPQKILPQQGAARADKPTVSRKFSRRLIFHVMSKKAEGLVCELCPGLPVTAAAFISESSSSCQSPKPHNSQADPSTSPNLPLT